MKKIKILTMFVLSIILTYSFTNIVFSMPLSEKVIVIDAGHGGWDPGKVSDAGNLEKDINLQIAAKLQAFLELSDASVHVIRLDDTALGDRKVSDMRGRAEIINNSKADVLISIHQNSYKTGDIKGVQTFYYPKSEESKVLAEKIQNTLKQELNQVNNRGAKAEDSYYMLKKTEIPAVIVECGFLSNKEEANLLSTSEYQEKIAWGIYKGILDYFGKN